LVIFKASSQGLGKKTGAPTPPLQPNFGVIFSKISGRTNTFWIKFLDKPRRFGLMFSNISGQTNTFWIDFQQHVWTNQLNFSNISAQPNTFLATVLDNPIRFELIFQHISGQTNKCSVDFQQHILIKTNVFQRKQHVLNNRNFEACCMSNNENSTHFEISVVQTMLRCLIYVLLFRQCC
jgi:hypothetical protein